MSEQSEQSMMPAGAAEQTPPPAGAADQAAPPSPAEQTGRFVATTVRRIQAGLLRPTPSSWSRAALARLRRGLGKEPQECPDLAEFYLDPDAPAPGRHRRPAAGPDVDAPTRAERAAHLATGLYAAHQQSQAAPMHQPGTSFGTAVGALRWAGDQENPGVLRRFQALGTAGDLAEAAQHARGLVQLLRQAGRGFDYGDFAADLVRFQDPAQAPNVRLKWGRGFYARRADAEADARTAAPDARTSAAAPAPAAR